MYFIRHDWIILWNEKAYLHTKYFNHLVFPFVTRCCRIRVVSNVGKTGKTGKWSISEVNAGKTGKSYIFSSDSFYNHGKCKFWDVWMAHDKPDLTDIFIELSNTPSEINEQHMKMLEIFILKVYNIDPSYTDIDEARLN